MEKLTRRAFITTALGAAAASLLATPVTAFATPTSSEKQAEADTVSAQLGEWQTQLNEASDNYYVALDEHDAAVTAMDEAQGRIDEAEATIASLQDRLTTRADTMYKNGSTSFIDVLLGASSFEDFVSTWDFLKDMNEADAETVEATKVARAEAQAAHDEYAAQEALAAQKLAEAEEIKNNAESIVSQYQAQLDSLDAEVAALVAQEQAAAAAAVTAASSSTSNSSGGGSYVSSSPVPANGSVVDYAYSRLGCPYVWGATGPNTFDCSGLTSWCYAQAGVSIPRTSGGQYSGASTRLAVSAAEPGDVLWMSGHVGICIGGGAFIHAPQTGDVVKISYNMGMWSCALRF